jgi:hypothetical protein
VESTYVLSRAPTRAYKCTGLRHGVNTPTCTRPSIPNSIYINSPACVVAVIHLIDASSLVSFKLQIDSDIPMAMCFVRSAKIRLSGYGSGSAGVPVYTSDRFPVARNSPKSGKYGIRELKSYRKYILVITDSEGSLLILYTPHPSPSSCFYFILFLSPVGSISDPERHKPKHAAEANANPETRRVCIYLRVYANRDNDTGTGAHRFETGRSSGASS